MTAATNCAHCGTPMPTPTGRQARRRYCSELCRKAAWRHRHRDKPTTHDDPPGTVSHPVSHPVSDVVIVPTASRDAVANPGGQHRCPHCRQPLSIISVIVPAAAAHVATPEVMQTHQH